MSHLSPNAPHSQALSSDSSPFPDSAALAATLQAVAQALLCHGEQVFPSASKEGGAFLSGGSASARAENVGETRCYYFSPSVVRHERELLKKYHAEDFRGLIAQTHVLLVGLVKLMKSVHPDARMRGHVVASLGSVLEQASSLVLRMQNVYDRVELVEAPAAV